eukprot:Pgem_evm1s10984
MSSEEQRVQALRDDANDVTNLSLEATRRMQQIAVETEQIGNATLQNINEQGEIINRIEGGLENINQNVGEAEKELEDLEKCCGCF